MLTDAVDPAYAPPTSVDDLTGFWEMVEIQVAVFLCCFLKNPLKKGKILQSGRGENHILVTILRFDNLPEEI